MPIMNNRSLSSLASVLFLCLIPLCRILPIHAQEPRPAEPAAPSQATNPSQIVIGFAGGYVSSTNMNHAEVQLAATLRKSYSPDVYVGAFENHKGAAAYQKIIRLLDTDHDGTLSPQEKKNAHIIMYGHSWGASECLEIARMLQKIDVPVLLTIQVDSVAKPHQDDGLVPANVLEAANFYQPYGHLHGRAEIRAADPSHTKILGNYAFDYKTNPVKCKGYPWWDQVFAKYHTEIECDTVVWDKIDSLIRASLPKGDQLSPAPIPAIAPTAEPKP
jgi:hypothetical protein